MYTREELEALDGPGRTEAFHKLMEAVYGTREPVRRIVCEDLTVSEQGFRRWLREDQVQLWALLLLREWAKEAPKDLKRIVAWQEIGAALAGVTAQLADLTSKLEALSRDDAQ